MRRQSAECADCGTAAAAAAVEVHGFELQEEQQVYSAVGAAAAAVTHSRVAAKEEAEKVKGRARSKRGCQST